MARVYVADTTCPHREVVIDQAIAVVVSTIAQLHGAGMNIRVGIVAIAGTHRVTVMVGVG